MLPIYHLSKKKLNVNISTLIYRSSAADVNLPSEGTKNKGSVPVLKATIDNLNDIQYHDLDDGLQR